MKRHYLISMVLILFLSSCSTYYMNSGSLKEQLQKIDPNKIDDSYDFRLGIIGVIPNENIKESNLHNWIFFINIGL